VVLLVSPNFLGSAVADHCLAAGKQRQVFIETIGKRRSRFTSIAALGSAPRRTDQLWWLDSALNDACQLESLNTIGGEPATLATG
jgi:hypothetical protein